MTENSAEAPEPVDVPDEDEWPEGASPYDDDGDEPAQETEVYDPADEGGEA